MDRQVNHRAAGRIMVNVECYGAATRQKGRAQISDLSRNGAMISRTGLVPSRGELVGITIERDDGLVLLIGWVVRHIDHGFAIEFDHLDEKAAAFVDNAAAVVPSRGRGKQSDQ